MTDKIQLDLRGNRDEVFKKESEGLNSFRFNANVAAVFDDMASRSIPMYRMMYESLVKWAAKAPISNCNRIYDIGCSTGTGICLLANHLQRQCQFIGIDTSIDMLNAAKAKLSEIGNHEIALVHNDAVNYEYEPTSLVILNYTMQFLPISMRERLLQKISDALIPGGILFMSEKLTPEGNSLKKPIEQIYDEYKRSHGYSDIEILEKKKALQDFLIPITEQEHRASLQSVGLTEHETILKWHQFATFIAIKR